jgi:hypothetical protein
VSRAEAGTTLASIAYTLDDAGNGLTETATGVPLSGTTAYTSDATHRLSTVAYPGGDAPAGGGDPSGHRTSATANGTITHAA